MLAKFDNSFFQLSEKKGDNDDEQEKGNADENKSKDEVVFIQDVGFSVKIISPGADPFDIQVRRFFSIIVLSNFRIFFVSHC